MIVSLFRVEEVRWLLLCKFDVDDNFREGLPGFLAFPFKARAYSRHAKLGLHCGCHAGSSPEVHEQMMFYPMWEAYLARQSLEGRESLPAFPEWMAEVSRDNVQPCM